MKKWFYERSQIAAAKLLLILASLVVITGLGAYAGIAARLALAGFKCGWKWVGWLQ